MLTDTQIRKSKPQDRPFSLNDTRGLFLLVRPNGSKWWRFRYSFAGKRNCLGLGIFPDVSLADARQRRDDARRLVAQGVDPSEQRKALKAAAAEAEDNTFAAVAARWQELELPNQANPETAALIDRSPTSRRPM